jgi:predicted RNA-binding protein
MKRYFLHSIRIYYTHNGLEYYKTYTKFCRNIKQTRLYKNAMALLDSPENTAFKIEINKS